MRARFLNENVSDVLKPKSQEELNKAFREGAKMSWDKYLMYIKQLEDTGVEVIEPWSWRINKATIKVFKVFKNNWNVGTTATKEDALAMIQMHRQYSHDDDSYTISNDDHEFLDPKQIKKLIAKRRMKIANSTKFVSDKFSDRKYTSGNLDYKKWEKENWEDIWAKRKEDWEKEDIIDENFADVLAPKSKDQIIKDSDLDPEVINYLLKWDWIPTFPYESQEGDQYHTFERNGAEILVNKWDNVDAVKRYVSDTHF